MYWISIQRFESFFARTSPCGSAYVVISCLLFSIIAIITFYPGFMVWDAVGQLQQARSGQFQNLAPPIMSFIWRYLEIFVRGPFAYLLINTAITLYALHTIFHNMSSTRYRINILCILTVFFFPPIFSWAGAITKDITFNGVVLLSTAIFYQMHRREKSSTAVPIRLFSMSICVLCLIFATTLRYNGIIVVAIVVMYGVRPYFDRFCGSSASQILYCFAAVTAVTVMIGMVAVIVNRALTDVERYPLAQVMASDISGISVRNINNALFRSKYDTQLDNILNQGRSMDELPRMYNPMDWSRTWDIWGDGVFHYPRSEGEVSYILSVWRRMVMDYPISYISHRWAGFSKIIGIENRWLYGPTHIESYKLLLDENHNATVDFRLSPFQSFLSERLKQAAGTGLFHPALYLLLSFIIGWWARSSYSRNRNFIWMLLASGIVHEAGLFFVAPSTEHRFSLWLILAVWTATVVKVAETLDARLEAREA